MIARLSRKLTRLAFMAVLAGIATLLLAGTGSALEHQLPGNHGRGEVKAACGARGGVYTSSKDGSYGCAIEGAIVDCTAKGSCVCDGSQCAHVKKGGLNGVLRPPASAGTASSAGGTATKRRLPVNQVGGLKTSGGTTGGGTHPVVLERSAGHSGGSKH